MLIVQVIFSVSCIAISLNGCIGAQVRIIGGQDALDRYEFMISLQTYQEEKNLLGMGTGQYKYFHRCGGSIVTEDCIVTAAHCVAGNITGPLSIFAGSNDLDDTTATRRDVHSFVMHPNYTELAENDVAVLRLPNPLTFSFRIGPITLSNAYVDGGVPLRLIGWGYTDSLKLQPLPRKLQEINTESITQQECNSNILYQPTETDICTRRTGYGASNGDSGGPLILYNLGNWVLVGIVSRGFIISAFVTMPDIFTRASVFYDWINEQCNKPINTP